MISFDNSLQFWSVVVLLSIILFIFVGGLWVSIQTWFTRSNDDPDLTLRDGAEPELSFNVNEQHAEIDPELNEPDPDDPISYLRRTTPRLPS